MIRERLTVGPFAENCYVIGPAGDDHASRVAIVDPGAESERIAATIDARGWRPEAVLLTHGHIDHVAHCAHLCERYGIAVHMHRADLFLLASPQFPEFAAMLGARPCPEPASFFEEETPVEVAGLRLRVLHTPGHTPGSVCLVDEASGQALVGDTVFYRGVGRTDLPGGDFATLASSVRDRLFALPGDLVLWPGHGPETRLEEERAENPFFGSHLCALV
ncbi:MAG TPA: MBL fold metallo-hydrolase [Thermoanaerobaculia bacterium]|jgi:glyoxylase-like metal-dependent hydrolase (beta-lactamase superfamily II)|nr:MBL fold metallo-hydrolase [Thermoanaerobaculia bacterium]